MPYKLKFILLFPHLHLTYATYKTNTSTIKKLINLLVITFAFSTAKGQISAKLMRYLDVSDTRRLFMAVV